MMFGRFPLGGWNPLAAGVPLAWFDASILSTLTLVSGKVSVWASRVGSYTVAQTNSSIRPTYSATGYRSKAPGVSFSPTPFQWLQITSTGLATYLTGTNVPFTVVVRMQAATPAAGGRIIAWDYTTGGNSAFIADVKTNGHLRVDFTSGGSPSDGLIQLTDASLGTTVAIAESTSVDAWVTDTQGSTGPVGRLVDAQLSSSTGGGTTTCDQFGIGNNTILGNSPFSGTIAELIIWPSRLSSANVFAADAYLAAKWG